MSNKTLTLYKFGDFCLDTDQRKLFYANTPVSITPKAFQTLVVLLKNRHQIVDKEFLLNEVWADTFVEETTLSQNILTLRKTLGAYQKGDEFIVTFPRRGFRFVADVQEIISEDETIIIEKNTRTHIITEQQQIHDSADVERNERITTARKISLSKNFLAVRTTVLVLVGFICAVVSAFLTWYFIQPNGEIFSQNIRFNTLISDANIKNAVISPNGKYLVLVKEKDEIQSLLLRQIETNNIIEIVPKLNGKFIGLSFSPDSEQIFYSVSENNEGMLYKIPLLGGASQMLVRNIESPAAISFDNKHLAFIRRNAEVTQNLLVIADIEGKNERILLSKQSNNGFSPEGLAWSPNGKNLSLIVSQSENGRQTNQIVIVNSESGEEKMLTKENWSWAGQTVWSKDGRGILVPVFRANSPTISDELWYVSYPDGKAKYLTNGIKGKLGISLNKENDSLIALKSEKLTCFLTASLDNFKKSNHVSTRIGDTCVFPAGADWTNDGKIIYSTNEGGNADIWTINEEGGEKRQLTADSSAEISPKMSKDGSFLIFLSNRSGKINVWRTNANGTNPMQITNQENVKETIISPDGKFIFYLAQDSEAMPETLWKVSINGENSQQITKKTTQTPRISPDGKMIAAYYSNDENKMNLTLFSVETGEAIKYLETPPHDDLPFLDWAKNGENLYLILREGKVYSIWKLSFADNKFEKIREWENDAIFRFAVSKDGERVFYEVGTEITSVIQFDNLKLF